MYTDNCRRYRQRLAIDNPHLQELMKKRARKTRKTLKVYFCFLLQSFGLALWRSMAWRTIIAGLYYILHFKVFPFHLFVVCFQGKEKAERSRASGTAPSRPTTRLDQERADRRRETVRRSVQKHREKQSLQKKWRVNKKKEWPITTEWRQREKLFIKRIRRSLFKLRWPFNPPAAAIHVPPGKLSAGL